MLLTKIRKLLLLLIGLKQPTHECPYYKSVFFSKDSIAKLTLLDEEFKWKKTLIWSLHQFSVFAKFPKGFKFFDPSLYSKESFTVFITCLISSIEFYEENIQEGKEGFSVESFIFIPAWKSI